MPRPAVRPDPKFRLLERRYVYEGRMVRISEDRIHLPNGHETTYETIHLPSAVTVVPLLEKDGAEPEVVFVDQFRPALEGHIYELPAGIVEEGEDPAACAARELEEETGFAAGRVRHLATLYMIPGTSAHCMYFYLAEDLRPGRQELDAGECLEVRRVPLGTALRALSGGNDDLRVVDTKSHLGLLHAAWVRGFLGGDGGGP